MVKPEEVRSFLREQNVSQWQVADILGISESAFCRELRTSLSDERYQDVKGAAMVVALRNAEKGHIRTCGGSKQIRGYKVGLKPEEKGECKNG